MSQNMVEPFDPSQDAGVVGSNEPSVKRSFCSQFAGFLDEGKGVVLMTAFTLYALFGNDIMVAGCPKSADDVFTVFTCIAFVLFLVEFIAFTVAKPGYRLSFFFFLDLVAVLSIITDIPFVWEPLYAAIAGDDNAFNNDLAVARAGRASRAGTKAGRMVRVIRVIRLFRIVKLYKYANEEEREAAEAEEREAKENFSNGVSGSEIGKRLSEKNTQLVIMGVLFMLIMLSGGFLQVETTENSGQFFIDRFDSWQSYTSRASTLVPVDANFASSALNKFKDVTFKSKILLFAKLCTASVGCIGNDTYYVRDQATIDLLRPLEIKKLSSGYMTSKSATAGDNVPSVYSLWLDNKQAQVDSAVANICLTWFILFLLGGGAMKFSQDAHEMVIEPIERMIAFVTQLANSPLGKLKRRPKSKHAGAGFETEILEITLMKMAGLLQIGFGEAGAEIIGKNLSSAGLNVMIPGSKVFAIYGFCDIRKFNDSTEYLKEHVMSFVNQIAEIVHERCHRFKGKVNKNIGNSFLLVWRFPEQEQEETTKKKSISFPRTAEDATKAKSDSIPLLPPIQAAPRTLKQTDEPADPTAASLAALLTDPKTREGMQETANQAMCGFLHTIAAIATNPDLESWRKQDFDPNYNLEMGFGLHVGWAIEGAIGTPYKVDLSYLSPNVNMAARLKEATKQYGVPLLMSGSFFALLHPELQKKCRHLDRCCVKGSLIPMDVYTFDMSLNGEERVAHMVRGDAFTFNLTDLGYGGEDVFDKTTRKKIGVTRTLAKMKLKAKSMRERAREKTQRINKPQQGPDPDENVLLGEARNDGLISERNGDTEEGQLNENPADGEYFSFHQILSMCDILQENVPQDFIPNFNAGSDAYMEGNWSKAKSLFEKALSCDGYQNDKSCKLMLSVMGESNFTAPSDWKGYRMLTSK